MPSEKKGKNKNLQSLACILPPITRTDPESG